MSSTHLPGNKLVSTEKPGWVVATAEGRGSVKAVSTRGKDGRGQGKALIPPLQPPGQGRREPQLSLDLDAAAAAAAANPYPLNLTRTASLGSPCLPGIWYVVWGESFFGFLRARD